MSLLETIYKAANEPRHTVALDTVFDQIDDLLLNNKFGAVDFALQNMKITDLRLSILLSILTITKGWDNKLPNRIRFLNRVREEFKRRGEKIEEIPLLHHN